MANKHIDLGRIKQGKIQEVKFTVLDLEDIKEMASSCGCSVPKKNIETNQIIVKFTPDSIPVHLREQGYYDTTKQIVLEYKDNRQSLLSFSARITQ